MNDDPYLKGPPLEIAIQLVFEVIREALDAAARRGERHGHVLLGFGARSMFLAYHIDGRVLFIYPRYGLPTRKDQMEVRSHWFEPHEEGELVRWTFKPEFGKDAIVCFLLAYRRLLP